jgi:hypothetical protein
MTSFLARKPSSVAAVIVGFAVVLKLLTGCSQSVATGSQTPITSSAASTSSPQVDGQAADGNASGSGVARAGSFPRSFLIPGTETSIRIGGF